jgi:hypothetical protein
LKVWRNSSCVAFLPARKCTSSITSKIEVAHLATEGVELVVAQVGEELVGELFAGEIHPALGRVMLDEALAEPLEQVRFFRARSSRG